MKAEARSHYAQYQRIPVYFKTLPQYQEIIFLKSKRIFINLSAHPESKIIRIVSPEDEPMDGER